MSTLSGVIQDNVVDPATKLLVSGLVIGGIAGGGYLFMKFRKKKQEEAKAKSSQQRFKGSQNGDPGLLEYNDERGA
jgi:hypothetical protein